MYDAALLDILPKLTQRPERKYTQTNARNRSNDSLFRKVNKKKKPAHIRYVFLQRRTNRTATPWRPFKNPMKRAKRLAQSSRLRLR